MNFKKCIQFGLVLIMICIGIGKPIGMIYATETVDEDVMEDNNDIEDNIKFIDNDQNVNEDIDNEKSDVVEDVPVSDIEISDYDSELEVGKTINLTATILPFNATNSTVSFSSSDTSIATVNSSGEVKGISKGNVTIYVSCATIRREINLFVKVKTTSIEIDKEYLVMKPGDEFKLSISIYPIEANQNISFKSTDESVAVVSESGIVSAKSTGSTTIIVSNGELSNAVFVIVNKGVNIKDDTETQDIPKMARQGAKILVQNVTTSQVKKISTKMLYDLYALGEKMQVEGEGYSIVIEGSKIVNYNNELYTDIKLKRNSECIEFELNKGKYLCGELTLHIYDNNGKYLYLYNNVKNKYELVNVQNIDELILSTPGKYMITANKIEEKNLQMVTAVLTLVGGCIILGIIGYIVMKKKYWFW